jgi:hypothetical protein
MCNIPVCILTTGTRNDLLNRTINSLNVTGFSEVFLCYVEHTGNPCQGYKEVARKALELYGIDRPILIVEDDVVFCKDVVSYLANYRTLFTEWHTGICSLYYANGTKDMNFRDSIQEQGFLKLKTDLHLWGALAMIWNPIALREVFCLYNSDYTGHHTEYFICNTLIKLGYKIFVHNPSLCEHIGENRTTHDFRSGIPVRYAVNFIGENKSILDII